MSHYHFGYVSYVGWHAALVRHTLEAFNGAFYLKFLRIFSLGRFGPGLDTNLARVGTFCVNYV